MAEGQQRSSSLEELKAQLKGYREVLLPLKKVLEWEQSYYPAVLIAVITFITAIVWYLEPSVLTTICLLGLIGSIVDFLIPQISGYIFRSEWTAVNEQQFDVICGRIQHAKQHVTDLITYLAKLKKDKPTSYLLVLVGTFLVLAWLGCLIDNLLLTYLLVVILSLIPGLRKHGILQVFTDKIKAAIGGVKKGVQEKAKTN